jgi:hypothetical protein
MGEVDPRNPGELDGALALALETVETLEELWWAG